MTPWQTQKRWWGCFRDSGGRLYRRVNTFLLSKSQATRPRVLETRQTIARQATANDTVIALFSTQGTKQAGQQSTVATFNVDLTQPDPDLPGQCQSASASGTVLVCFGNLVRTSCFEN